MHEVTKTVFARNAVNSMDPERAKAVLIGVVDLCLQSRKYDLTAHSAAWNYLAETGALETGAIETSD